MSERRLNVRTKIRIAQRSQISGRTPSRSPSEISGRVPTRIPITGRTPEN